MTHKEALQSLLAGNARFAAGTALKPNQDQKRRAEIATGQHPIAIVVSCSDSRLAPEIVFDQGLGDLFVVRTAGEVTDNVALASIEYAAEHLRVPLIVVLGHQHCGAVAAACENHDMPGHLNELLAPIKESVSAAKAKAGDLADNASKANVARIVSQLKNSEPILSHLVKENKLEIAGAYYNLDSGIVSLTE